MNPFHIGDTVYLKSGSPRMTVTGVNGVFITVCWVAYESATLHTTELPALAFDLHKATHKEGTNT